MIAASYNFIHFLLNTGNMNYLTSSDTLACVCPDDMLTFECGIIGIGSTVWSGSVLDCSYSNNEIVLLHNQFSNGTRKLCNNGAVLGASQGRRGNYYVSQLKINISADMNDKNIQCSFDDGFASQNVGTRIIEIGTCIL